MSLFLSRSPLSKTPKQVFFNPINFLSLLSHSITIYNLLFSFNVKFIIYRREFALVLIYSLLPKKNGIPDVAALRKMYSAFVRADDMSPTQSSADVVEWNEYCSVTLWFEEDERVHEEVAWQIRDLMW